MVSRFATGCIYDLNFLRGDEDIKNVTIQRIAHMPSISWDFETYFLFAEAWADGAAGFFWLPVFFALC